VYYVILLTLTGENVYYFSRVIFELRCIQLMNTVYRHKIPPCI